MCLCGSFLSYPKGIFTFSPSREYYKPNTNIKTQVQWPGLRIISPLEFALVVSCFCLVFLINLAPQVGAHTRFSKFDNDFTAERFSTLPVRL